jgi:hypothetical protein
MNLPVFAKSETVLFAVIVIGAGIALWSLATGRITI